MNLPIYFKFSQGVLQDFVDCRRRFYLRYLKHLSWPAIVSDPVEEFELHIQRGVAFHHMVNQHLNNVPSENLSEQLLDPQLASWWSSFHNCLRESGILRDLLLHDNQLITEFRLVSDLAGFRLTAQYDLLVINPTGKIVILDWKTSFRRPTREWLAKRLQTRIYAYLLVKAGKQLINDKYISPEKVEFRYWFTEFPAQPIVFAYSQSQYLDDEAYLIGVITQIVNLPEEDFGFTPDEITCGYCIYRSLCDRGIKAGDIRKIEALNEEDMERILDLDFEHAEEVAW